MEVWFRWFPFSIGWICCFHLNCEGVFWDSSIPPAILLATFLGMVSENVTFLERLLKDLQLARGWKGHVIFRIFRFTKHDLPLIDHQKVAKSRKTKRTPGRKSSNLTWLVNTWSMGSRTCKWLVTTIYRPWKGHLEGEGCPRGLANHGH